MTNRRGLGNVLGALALVTATATGAWALHDEPPNSRTLAAGLVTAYEPCTSPNTQTQGISPVPSCAAAVRSDPICGFGNVADSPGRGKVLASIRGGEVAMNFQALGLTSGCEGHRLCGVIVLRVTTHRCPNQPCTTQDVELINPSPDSCCTVYGGRCRFKAANPSEDWDALQDGDRAGAEVLSCGLRRVTGPNQPPPGGLTFSCGLLSP